MAGRTMARRETSDGCIYRVQRWGSGIGLYRVELRVGKRYNGLTPWQPDPEEALRDLVRIADRWERKVQDARRLLEARAARLETGVN